MDRRDKKSRRAALLAVTGSALLFGCMGTEMMLDSSGLTPSGDYLAGMIASDFEGASEAMARAASADPAPGSVTQGSNIYTRQDTLRQTSSDRILASASLRSNGTLDVRLENDLDDTWAAGRWDQLRTGTADIVHHVKATGHDGTPLYGQQLGKSFSGDVPSTVWASVWSTAETLEEDDTVCYGDCPDEWAKSGLLIGGVWAERREYGWKNEWTLGAFANGPNSARTGEDEREQVWNQMGRESGGMQWSGRAAGIFMERNQSYEVSPFIGQVNLDGSVGGDAPWIEGELTNLIKVNLDGTYETETVTLQLPFGGGNITLDLPDFLTDSIYTFERAAISDRSGGFFTSDVSGTYSVGGSELALSGRWGGEMYGGVGQHVIGTFALHGSASQLSASMIGTFGTKSTHHFHEKLPDMLEGRRDDGMGLLQAQAIKPVQHTGGVVSQHDGPEMLSVSLIDQNYRTFLSITDSDEDGWGTMNSDGIVTLEDDDWGPGTSDREFERQVFYKIYDHDRIAMIDARSIEIGTGSDAPHIVLGNWAENHGYPGYSNGATGAFAGAADDHRAPSSAIKNALSSGEARYEGDAWGYYSYRYPSHSGDEATLTRMEASITLWAKQDDYGYQLEGELHNLKTARAGRNITQHIWPIWLHSNRPDLDLEAAEFDPEVAGGPSSGDTWSTEHHGDECIPVFYCGSTMHVESEGKWGAQFYGADAGVVAGTFGFEGGKSGFETAVNGTFIAERVDD